jgi:ABC-type uncharacterized transport system permease subunit
MPPIHTRRVALALLGFARWFWRVGLRRYSGASA